MKGRPGFQLAAAAIVVVLVPVLLLAHVRFYSSASRLPERGVKRVRLSGLTAPVEVVIDQRGVGHVRAENESDAWFSQGYLHARERFFQMDLSRRTAAGRLSELFGESHLPVDRSMRMLRLGALALRYRTVLSEGSQGALDSYAAGVNAALEQYGSWISPEVWALGVEPEPWKVEDSLVVALLVHLDSSRAMTEELDRAVQLSRLGRKRAVELWGWTEHDAKRWIPPVEPPSTPRDDDDPFTRAGLAASANAWLMAPSQTAGKAALVASDLHLPVTVPSGYFLCHLETPDLHASGASIPGLPGILVGHTESVAWTLSPAMVDDQDLYVLNIGESRLNELVDGTWRPLRTVTERIDIRWRKAPELLKVRLSERGPLVRDSGGQAVALAWTGAVSPPLVDALLAMPRSSTVEEVEAAWQGVSGPNFDLLAADTKGRIVHHLVGLFPDRGRGAGRLPAPGEDSRWAWRGLVPAAGELRTVNPESGFLATANHDMFNEGDHPLRLRVPGEYLPPWRVRRIRSILSAPGQWTVDDCLNLQQDDLSFQAVTVLKTLWPDLSEHAGRTARELFSWDGTFDAEASEPLLYARLMAELSQRIGGDEARREGLRTTPFGADEVLRLLAGGLDAAWWDDLTTELVEGRAEVIQSSLDAIDGAAVEGSWGDTHQVHYEHPLASFEVLGPFFRLCGSLPPIASGGASDTVFNTGSSEADSLMTTRAPALLFVAEVGNWDATRMAVLPGQSGRLWSPHYANQIGAGRVGDVPVFPFSREAVDAAATARLLMEPAGGKAMVADEVAPGAD